MPKFETNARKIAARLEREGWINKGGSRHDLYRHPDKKGVITMPRHRTITSGVAQEIAKKAGWI